MNIEDKDSYKQEMQEAIDRVLGRYGKTLEKLAEQESIEKRYPISSTEPIEGKDE